MLISVHRLCSLIVAMTVVAATVVTSTALAQPTTLRIATYNLLKYPTSDVDERNRALRTVIAAMRPDVLVAQEVESAVGMELFRDSVLDRSLDGQFEAAPFVNASTDTEGAFFYDTTRVTYLGMVVVATELRAILGYRFAVLGTSDTVWIYSVHLKAEDRPDDRAQRGREAALLRAHLDAERAGQHVIVAGDFNVYFGTEPALLVLQAEEGNDRARLIDPLASVSDWHMNAEFAAMHTQSPRTTQFGGGSNGGLDDRFDIILISRTLSSIIDRGTYTAFGNDGQHFNKAINEGVNAAVNSTIAQALHDASDHLPVFADFRFGVAAAPEEPKFAGLHVAPNPAAGIVRFVFEGSSGAGWLVIRRVDGGIAARIAVREGDVSAVWNSRRAPSGLYSYSLETRTHRAQGTVTIVR